MNLLCIFIYFGISFPKYTQYIDHTNESLGCFNQSYYNLSDDNSKPSAIVYICGMESLSACTLKYNPSAFTSLTNSSIFYLEHRYYGESIPFPNATLESLQYLTVDQIIDDIASFCQFLKNEFNINFRIFLIGDEYSGSLAVWTKQQYPNLIDSVWANSSPLLASTSYFGSDSYYSNYLYGVYPYCISNISTAIREISDQMIINNQTYIDEIYKSFNITNETFPVARNVVYSLSMFIYDLIDEHINFNYENLQLFCSDFDKPSKFISKTKIALKNNDKTLNSYNPTYPLNYSDQSVKKKYQYCTELGWIPSSSNFLDYAFRILPPKYNWSYIRDNICLPLFNKTIENIDYFNARHGRRSPGVQSVIYTSATNGKYKDLQHISSGPLESNRREILDFKYADYQFSALDGETVQKNEQLKYIKEQVIGNLSNWTIVDDICKNGVVIYHTCVCNKNYFGRFCENYAKNYDYEIVAALCVAVPTFMMLVIGLIAWCTFVQSSKTTKIIC